MAARQQYNNFGAIQNKKNRSRKQSNLITFWCFKIDRIQKTARVVLRIFKNIQKTWSSRYIPCCLLSSGMGCGQYLSTDSINALHPARCSKKWAVDKQSRNTKLAELFKDRQFEAWWFIFWHRISKNIQRIGYWYTGKKRKSWYNNKKINVRFFQPIYANTIW